MRNISLLAIAAGAGASGAINQWYDSDIDAIMKRTSRRPIPSGEVKPEEALAFGVTISIISVLILSLSANFLAGGLLAFTIIFYGLIYTVCLKRFTAQNIVIGGAAGALPAGRQLGLHAGPADQYRCDERRYLGADAGTLCREGGNPGLHDAGLEGRTVA